MWARTIQPPHSLICPCTSFLVTLIHLGSKDFVQILSNVTVWACRSLSSSLYSSDSEMELGKMYCGCESRAPSIVFVYFGFRVLRFSIVGSLALAYGGAALSLIPCSRLWRVCPHLCWDNLLVYPDFPSFICFYWINDHFCGQIYPKLELSLSGIPANRAHPKRDSKSNNWLNNYYLKEREA